MTNHKKGKEYEDFVESVYKAILEAEQRDDTVAPISVERNKIIHSKSGTPSEIDIYWEFERAGIKHSVAVECRNYKRKVDISKVRDFADKISNISGLKGLIVSKKGFSQEAIKRAAFSDIDLIVLREHQEQDWDGYLKEVHVQIHILKPSQLLSFSVYVNKKWASQNGYKENLCQPNRRNDLLIIEDKTDGFRHSLKELEENDFYEEKESGKHIWDKVFKDGWLHYEHEHIKIDRVQIEYLKFNPAKDEFSINFEKYVLAVMEYIQGKEGKFVVLTSGEKKSY